MHTPTYGGADGQLWASQAVLWFRPAFVLLRSAFASKNTPIYGRVVFQPDKKQTCPVGSQARPNKSLWVHLRQPGNHSLKDETLDHSFASPSFDGFAISDVITT